MRKPDELDSVRNCYSPFLASLSGSDKVEATEFSAVLLLPPVTAARKSSPIARMKQPARSEAGCLARSHEATVPIQLVNGIRVK